jgi:hypothetical protein
MMKILTKCDFDFRCVQGYQGNPLKLGDYCRIITGPTCDCDSRGIVPNTQCDEISQQCQCKVPAFLWYISHRAYQEDVATVQPWPSKEQLPYYNNSFNFCSM